MAKLDSVPGTSIVPGTSAVCKIGNGVGDNKLNACIKDDSDNCYILRESREDD